MSESVHPFCDVALPVPLDQVFTYQLPLNMRRFARRGCRVLAPFGSRNLIGIILHSHGKAPEQATRSVLKVLDEDPVLDEELLKLGKWIADYYSAPLGEVLRGMLPLGGEYRKRKTYSLSRAGQDAARQLFVAEFPDAATELLQILSERPSTEEYLAGKVKGAEWA